MGRLRQHFEQRNFRRRTDAAWVGTVALCVLLGAAACSPAAPDASAPRAKTSESAKTATNFDGVNLKDTTEDGGTATAGEDLAKATAGKLVGQPAPLATMTTIDGKTIDLGQVYGKKPVYIKFWATWCVPCRQQMPGFERMFETLGDKIQIVAVNIGLSDDEASVRAFRIKYGLKMPVVIDDGRLASLFHLGVTPQHVLIGKDVRFAYFGHADNQGLHDAVARVVAGEGTTGTATASVAGEARVYRVGDAVPALSVETTTGGKATLGGARPGKVQAVEFVSSWCEWYLAKTRPGTAKACAKARVDIEAAAAANPAVEWLGIAGGPWSTAQDLADYRKNNKVTIPLALDQAGALFRAFGIRDIPTIAVIDSDGRLVKVFAPGETDIAAAIRAASTKARGA